MMELLNNQKLSKTKTKKINDSWLFINQNRISDFEYKREKKPLVFYGESI